MRPTLVSYAALAVGLAATTPLMAQETAPGVHATTTEEIVVTARKRSETLISAPVVVTALGSADLQKRGISNLDAVARATPQLLIGPQGGSVQGGNISMRGISGPASNPFGDQAVSFNIDGVMVGKAFVRRMSDTDISQLEVLKGPQALFYGKNSPGGVVSIHTADPTDHFETKVSVGYEFYAREIRTEGYVSGPITDKLGARFSGYYSHMDGWLKDQTSPTSLYYQDARNPRSSDWALRGTLKFTGEKLDAKLKLNYAETHNNGPASTTEFNDCPLGVRLTGMNAQCSVGRFNVNASSGPVVGTIPASMNHFGDGKNFQDQRQFLGSFEVNYQLSDAWKITSTSGLYWVDLDQCQNYENDDSIILPSCNPTDDREVSTELRIASDYQGPVNFIGGGYYADTYSRSGSMTYLFASGFDLLAPAIPGVFPGLGGPNTPARVNNYHLKQNGSAYSFYGQLVIKPVKVIEVDLGGRFSHEEKDIFIRADGLGFPSAPFLDPSFTITPLIPKKAWDDFSPEATIAYRPNSNLTIFASYRWGFLSGGYNSSSATFVNGGDFSYNPERIKGFETGVKTSLLNGNLNLNLAGYFYDITGLQVTSFTNATGKIRNAGGVAINGVEGDFNYRTPLDGLMLHGGAAYNQARYTESTGAPCYNGQTPALGCIFAPGQPNNGTQVLSDTQLIQAPKWNIVGGIDYETPIGSMLKLGVSVNATHSSGYLTDATSAPQSHQPSYTLLDATVRLTDQNDTWEVALIGRNLTDEYVIYNDPNVPFTGTAGPFLGTGVGLGDRFASVGRGREVMLRASYKFSGK